MRCKIVLHTLCRTGIARLLECANHRKKLLSFPKSFFIGLTQDSPFFRIHGDRLARHIGSEHRNLFRITEFLRLTVQRYRNVNGYAAFFTRCGVYFVEFIL